MTSSIDLSILQLKGIRDHMIEGKIEIGTSEVIEIQDGTVIKMSLITEEAGLSRQINTMTIDKIIEGMIEDTIEGMTVGTGAAITFFKELMMSSDQLITTSATVVDIITVKKDKIKFRNKMDMPNQMNPPKMKKVLKTKIMHMSQRNQRVKSNLKKNLRR
jgi:hypothetical protein